MENNSICLGHFPDAKLVLKSGKIVWCHRLFLSRFEYFKIFLLSKKNEWKACKRKQILHGVEMEQVDHFVEYDCSKFDVDEDIMVDLLRFTYSKSVGQLQLTGLENAHEYAHAVSYLGLHKSFVKSILDLILKPILIYAKTNVIPDDNLDALLQTLVSNFSLVHPDLTSICYPMLSTACRPKVLPKYDLGEYFRPEPDFKILNRKLLLEERKIGYQISFHLTHLAMSKNPEPKMVQVGYQMIDVIFGSRTPATDFYTFVDKFLVKFTLTIGITTKSFEENLDTLAGRISSISLNYTSSSHYMDRPFGIKEFEYELDIFNPVNYLHVSARDYVVPSPWHANSYRMENGVMVPRWKGTIDNVINDCHFPLIRDFDHNDMIIFSLKVYHHVPQIPQ